MLTSRMGPIPQPPSYHQFADQRTLLGIPRFADVVSNIGFAIVGVWGIIFLRQQSASKRAFIDLRERWPYMVAFLGFVLTSAGSAYYHVLPTNARLVWDRLPMTIVFGALIGAMIAERISVEAGLNLLPLVVLASMGSVLQWYWDELHGRGDLRFYASVQVYSALVLILVLLIRSRYTHGYLLAVVFGFYVLAKVFEELDDQIFSRTRFVSGHTLKHLAAAAAGYCILRMLQRRAPLPAEFIAH